MIEVTLSDQQDEAVVDPEALAAFVERLAALTGSAADELSVVLVGEEAMRELNHRYRHKDRVTDVLSFPLGDDPAPDGTVNLGDLVICGGRAAAQAEEAGHDLWTEIRILLIHGFLHLQGMDHPESAGPGSEMEAEEQRLRELLIQQ